MNDVAEEGGNVFWRSLGKLRAVGGPFRKVGEKASPMKSCVGDEC